MNIQERPLWDLWDLAFYPCEIAGHTASVWLDLSLPHHTDRARYPFFHTLRVQLHHPDERGLSTRAEFETLAEIEERTVPLYEQAIEGVAVGRITTQGRRDFYFYGKHDSVTDTLREAVTDRFPDYEFSGGEGQHDSNWQSYFEGIYPNDLAYQFIVLQRTFADLPERNDAIAVRYCFYFEEEPIRARTMEQLQSFDGVTLREDASDSSGPFRLVADYACDRDLLTVYQQLERLACRTEEARQALSHVEFPAEVIPQAHVSNDVRMQIASEVISGLRPASDLKAFGLEIGEGESF